MTSNTAATENKKCSEPLYIELSSSGNLNPDLNSFSKPLNAGIVKQEVFLHDQLQESAVMD